MFPENNNTTGKSGGAPGDSNNHNKTYPNLMETAQALLSSSTPVQDLPEQQQQPLPPKSIPHPDFYHVKTHLSHPLVPLVSTTTGHAHPSFPTTILQYNLLTSAQLDELALHYHQTRAPTRNTFAYPIRVPAWIGDDVPIETKRRRWGRFIGLRGCESPVSGGGNGWDRETEEEMSRRLEREWEEALRRARSEDDERLLRWKAGGI